MWLCRRTAGLPAEQTVRNSVIGVGSRSCGWSPPNVAINGFPSHKLHLRDASLTTIVLSKLNLFPVDRDTRLLLRCMLELPAASAPMFTGHDSADMFVGMFQIGASPREIIAAEGGPASADQPGTVLSLSGNGTLFEASDPENTYRFFEQRDGKYQRIEARSPLWPPQLYNRVP